MTPFELTREAERDLNEIWLYIAERDLDAADRVQEDIYDAITRLREAPGAGHTRRDLTTKPLRFWGVHSYLIAYRVENGRLLVVRILSAARDIRAILG